MDSHDNWHKIAALIMLKQGLSELQIGIEDVVRLAAGNVNIVLDARREVQTGFLTVRIVDDKTAQQLAKLIGRAGQAPNPAIPLGHAPPH